jgi:hypothetical protein
MGRFARRVSRGRRSPLDPLLCAGERAFANGDDAAGEAAFDLARVLADAHDNSHIELSGDRQLEAIALDDEGRELLGIDRPGNVLTL